MEGSDLRRTITMRCPCKLGEGTPGREGEAKVLTGARIGGMDCIHKEREAYSVLTSLMSWW